jgi:hypothetical protein
MNKLERIAETLNSADTGTNGYSHWEHFCTLCAEHGLTPDGGRQDREDIVCAWSLYAFEGELYLSGGRWVVGDDGLTEAGMDPDFKGHYR